MTSGANDGGVIVDAGPFDLALAVGTVFAAIPFDAPPPPPPPDPDRDAAAVFFDAF